MDFEEDSENEGNFDPLDVKPKVEPSEFTDTVETPCHDSVNASAFDSTPAEYSNTEIKEEPEEYEEEYYHEENCDVSQSEPVSETDEHYHSYDFNDSHTVFATCHNGFIPFCSSLMLL